jgi:hypothetical protein
MPITPKTGSLFHAETQARAVYYGEISGPNCEAVRKFEEAAERRAREGAADLADQFECLVAQLIQGAAFLDRGEVDALYRVADKLRSAYGPKQD